MMVPYDLSRQAGGVKHHAVQLAQALRRMGDTVVVCGPATTKSLPDGMVGFRGVINIAGNGSDNHLGILTSPLAVRRFFHEQKFDLLHVHEPEAPMLAYWATWLTPRLPKVCTFHAFNEEASASVTRWRRLAARLLYRHYQRGISVSPAAARLVAANWARPLPIVPNGVSVADFRPSDGPRTPGPHRLLFVGGLADARKGAKVMLEAYRALCADKMPVALDLVGDPKGFGPLPDLPGLKHHAHLSFEELVARFRAADCLVAPALGQESFGMILLEAMACAKPVIYSDIEGYGHVAVEGGSIKVPPNDASALAAAICGLLNLPEKRLREMGAINHQAAQSYDWAHVARSVRQEYLAARSARPSEARS